MPIDYNQYPANWKEIRAAILKRDGHCCKFCGVPNYSYRCTKTGEVRPPNKYLVGCWPPGWSRIVLTIAHLEDPDPMNCEPNNLAALCQRCHLEYDRTRNLEQKYRNKEARTGQMVMEIATQEVSQ